MSYSITPSDLTPALRVPPAFLGGGRLVGQRTLAKAVECSGIGVHSGEIVHLRLCPAEEDAGVTFVRTDLLNGARTIKARWDHVVDTRLCTVIGNDHGGKVSTVEHLMSALNACGIDNVRVEIDGGEVPVMDGSADSFVLLIEAAGVVEQDAPKREIEILSPIEVEEGGKRARLSPCDAARYSVTIDFDRSPIMAQSCDVTLSPEAFKNEISRARTFGFFEEVDHLQKMGLARGGSLDNAIVIKGQDILNEGGLRFSNEFARHKVLDAIGDMALAGMPIRGHFEGNRCGHALNNRLLRELFATPEAWRVVESGSPLLQAVVY
ncbi:MAG: UDP-3-O-acyl-N-acetylglucosamine deacetylase [Alphaproteobacteria bacterium]|nr:UDP-3-O-acyl-N-acetylglucosamine deacetylase [Alphaproteobacteria bacterium]